MARVVVGEQLLVRRLVDVVEFLVDPGPKLLDEFVRVEPWVDHAEQHRQALGVVQVRGDRVGDTRVLDLNCNLAPIVGDGAMNLADRCGRDRLAVDLGEEFVERAAERGFDLGERKIRRHRRRIGMQTGERLAHRFRHAFAEVARHLAELHQRALHLAECAHDVFCFTTLEVRLEAAPCLIGGET